MHALVLANQHKLTAGKAAVKCIGRAHDITIPIYCCGAIFKYGWIGAVLPEVDHSLPNQRSDFISGIRDGLASLILITETLAFLRNLGVHPSDHNITIKRAL
jgi:hypothetical protein